ncbi:MAG TPA: hypothetical protein VKT19_07975 [Steroidobacteraceae bacterium]|nr:hypothetical protein [Steroidobacteraceae bacterium]
MNELTLNPDVSALAAGDKLVVPMPSIPGARRRDETRPRRRFNARVLQTSDGGFRPFRIY